MKKLVLTTILLSMSYPILAHESATPSLENKPIKVSQKLMDLKPMGTLIHNDKRVSKFSELLHDAKMQYILNQPGAMTVFAPTNKAMAELDADFSDKVWKDPQTRKAFIMSHIFAGKMTSDYLPKVDSLRSLSERKVLISNKEEGLAGMLINGASIVTTDINASNGVIHLVSSSFVMEQEQ